MNSNVSYNKRLFKIGEVAKMFHISMGTLRHYEQLGLLKPEYIDDRTGYRYYGASQFEVLNTIRYLRVLDIPLSEIAYFINNRDINVIEEKLVKQQAVIEQKKYELDMISRKIKHRLEKLHDATNSKLNVIKVVSVPSSRVVWLRDSLKLHSYLDLEYSISRLQENQKEALVFLGKVGVGISKDNLLSKKYNNYDLVFLMLDEEDEYEGITEEFPEMKCVTIRFCGSHNEAPKYYSILMKYIDEHNLKVINFSREVTLIDYGITNDTNKFVTEIQIPIE